MERGNAIHGVLAGLLLRRKQSPVTLVPGADAEAMFNSFSLSRRSRSRSVEPLPPFGRRSGTDAPFGLGAHTGRMIWASTVGCMSVPQPQPFSRRQDATELTADVENISFHQ